MHRMFLSAVIVLILALTACTEAPPEYPLNARVPAGQVQAEPDPDAEPVDVDAAVAHFAAGSQLVFTDAPMEVPAGPVVVEFELTAPAQHNVAIESINNGEPLVQLASPGTAQSDVIQLEVGQTYTYICTITGHAETMNGTFVAVEGAADGGEEAAPADGEEAAPADGEEAAPADGEEAAPTDGEDAPAPEATEEG